MLVIANVWGRAWLVADGDSTVHGEKWWTRIGRICLVWAQRNPQQRVTLGCFIEDLPVGVNDVLKSAGKPALLLKLGTWRCVCMRSTSLDEGFMAVIRPLLFCGYACWCDKPDLD